MKRTKSERTTPLSVKREVCLRAGGSWIKNSHGGHHCFGGVCEICGNRKMDIRGLKFMHKKRRKMGGTTSPEIHSPANIFRTCYVCDEENDGVRLPKSQPVNNRPPMPCLNQRGFHPYSREQQCGHKKE